MHANLAEVSAKARLHKGAGSVIQGLAGRLQHVVHNRRRAGRAGLFHTASLQHRFLFLAFVALLPSACELAAPALALHSEGRRVYCFPQFLSGYSAFSSHDFVTSRTRINKWKRPCGPAINSSGPTAPTKRRISPARLLAVDSVIGPGALESVK